MQFIFKDKTVVDFDSFVPQGKYLIKLNIKTDFSEGIWACIHPDDYDDYSNNVRDKKVRVAILMNQPISYPLPWGTYIPYRLNGSERPSDLIKDLDSSCKVEVSKVNMEE